MLSFSKIKFEKALKGGVHRVARNSVAFGLFDSKIESTKLIANQFVGKEHHA